MKLISIWICFCLAAAALGANPTFAEGIKSPFGLLTTDKEKLNALNHLQKSDNATYPYKLAWEIRDILSKLFPFSGCDKAKGHRSLLDCCASSEARYESVLEDEIRRAHELHVSHQSLSTIQKSLNNEFARYYPYDKPSPALQNYIQKYHLTLPKASGKEP